MTLTHNKRNKTNQSTLKASPSLRGTYRAASIAREQELEALRNSPHRIAILQAQCSLPDSDATALKSTKSSSEKALPPKPALRSQESPERRGVFDATDLTSRSLDTRFPPLEPASSPETTNSAQQSPAFGSVKITPSLLSSDWSPDSDSTRFVEHGVAKSTSIQSLGNTGAELCLEQSHTSNISCLLHQMQNRFANDNSNVIPLNKYTLIAPGSVKQQRIASLRHVADQKNGSPSKFSRRSVSGVKNINRSILRRGQTIGARGHPPLALADVGRQVELQPLKLGDGVSDTVRCTSITGSSATGTQSGDSLNDERVRESQRSSKYGYHIRESFDAHEVIMGEPGTSTFEKRNSRRHASPFSSKNSGRNDLTRELNIQLATPEAKGNFKEGDDKGNLGNPQLSISDEIVNIPHLRRTKKQVDLNQEKKTRVAARMIYRAAGVKPLAPTPSHPPRTSSLPGTPSSADANGSKDEAQSKQASTTINPSPEFNKSALSATGSNNDPMPTATAARAPRVSLFYRQTAASAARLTDKKNVGARATTPLMTHSRTISSFSDVGKGMKKFRKKVGKIIPGRRSTPVTVGSGGRDDTETRKDIYGTSPLTTLRHASPPLTTYKDSGMNTTSAEDLRHSNGITGGFTDAEPTDKHETVGTKKEKETWRNAPPNGWVIGDRNFRTHTDDTLLPPTQRRDGSEPLTPPSTLSGQDGHYVEAADVNESDSNADDDAVIDSNSTNRNSANPFLRSAMEIANVIDGAQTPQPPRALDRMLNETDVQARELMEQALSLDDDSEMRELMVRVATSLGESLIMIRQARIQVIRLDHAIDEMILIMSNNTRRMESLIRGDPQ